MLSRTLPALMLWPSRLALLAKASTHAHFTGIRRLQWNRIGLGRMSPRHNQDLMFGSPPLDIYLNANTSIKLSNITSTTYFCLYLLSIVWKFNNCMETCTNYMIISLQRYNGTAERHLCNAK